MAGKAAIRWCAVYTRKSSEEGLEQQFNSLHAQREAAEAYIKSQAHEGWKLIKTQYADGGLSGGTLQRPALQSLLGDIQARKIDVVVVAVKGVIHAPSAKPAMKVESRDALLTAIATARDWIDDIRLGRIASFVEIAPSGRGCRLY